MDNFTANEKCLLNQIDRLEMLVEEMVSSSMMIDDVMVNDEDFFTVFTRLNNNNGKWVTDISYHGEFIKKQKEHHSFHDAYNYHLGAIEKLNAIGAL